MPTKRKDDETCDTKNYTKPKSERDQTCDYCKEDVDSEDDREQNTCDMCLAVHFTHTVCVTESFVQCGGGKCVKVLCRNIANEGGCAESLHTWGVCNNCSRCWCDECQDDYLFRCEICEQYWCGNCSPMCNANTLQVDGTPRDTTLCLMRENQYTEKADQACKL